MNVAVGATFRTVTVAELVAVAPVESVACTDTVCVAGPSPAWNTTDCPLVSNEPLLSRSHAYVIASPSGSEPVAATVTEPPSSTLYGPPALTTGERPFTVTLLRYSRMPPSLSLISPPTLSVPRAGAGQVAVLAVEKAP